MTPLIVTCPETMAPIGQAITRQLSAALGVGEDWLAEAFTNAFWVAQDGSVQCVMSMHIADLEGLVSSFAALGDAPVEVWMPKDDPEADNPIPQAHLGGLVAVLGLGPQDALTGLGLARIPEPEE